MCCADVTAEVSNLGQSPGYGTYAEVTFRDTAGTNMAVGTNGAEPVEVSSFTLRFDGGAEITGLIQACDFLAGELRREPQRSVAEEHDRTSREALARAQEYAADKYWRQRARTE
jgi:hypothetical protein